MALNSGKILMRRGQEVNFDPSKMIPGEWAVSLDSKYVRMCFQPGVCVRMATYDAFEADMVQIQRILAECQTVEEAVQRIYEEIKDVAVDVERIETAAANALKSEQNALNSANSASQSANTATQKASDAAGSANTASAKAEQATEGARIATEKASEAANSAENVRNMSDVSQSYAVGGTGTREGEDTDNSKYYNQQASDNADRAEAAAERASAVADVGIATTEKAGLVRPDGETIRVDPDGTIHADRGTTSYTDLENKPKINDVVLEGEKTLDELGIASKEALEKTDNKVNIIIENAELKFKETANGENIHLNDSADSKLVEFAMYGKAVQNGEPTPESPIDIEVSGESYNLLPYPYVDTTKEVNGITFIDNKDGTITANGKATETTDFNFYRNTTFKKGKYIFSKGNNDTVCTLNVNRYKDDTYHSTIATTVNREVEFELTEDDVTNYTIRIYIRYSANKVVENLIFKPMIRKASVKNDRYMPYGKGSVEVKSVGKNLLPYPYNGFVHTDRGITWTDNKDGTVTANGTATSDAAFYFNEKHIFKAGNYILNGCPSGGSNSSYRIQLANSDWTVNYLDIGDGASVTLEENTKLEQFRIFIAKGTTVPNLTFKPMLRLASDTDSTYEPYKSKTATIQTENGLAGIPVESGGNYTDQNGQQWICDEIVKYADGSGEYIQRVKKVIFDGSSDENWGKSGINSNISYYTSGTTSGKYDAADGGLGLLCNRFQVFEVKDMVDKDVVGCSYGYAGRGEIRIGLGLSSSVNTVELFRTWLSNNPVEMVYQLKTPSSTPLTAEEIAEIEKLSTFYSVTNISNDADCGMKVKYIADSKNYIDNKLALQAKAREEEMMSMLLLLPEETQAKMIEKDTNNLLNESEA